MTSLSRKIMQGAFPLKGINMSSQGTSPSTQMESTYRSMSSYNHSDNAGVPDGEDPAYTQQTTRRRLCSISESNEDDQSISDPVAKAGHLCQSLQAQRDQVEYVEKQLMQGEQGIKRALPAGYSQSSLQDIQMNKNQRHQNQVRHSPKKKPPSKQK